MQFLEEEVCQEKVGAIKLRALVNLIRSQTNCRPAGACWVLISSTSTTTTTGQRWSLLSHNRSARLLAYSFDHLGHLPKQIPAVGITMPNPLTLKQRLAALSISPSNANANGSRTDLVSTPKSPGPRIRAFFNPSANKRAGDFYTEVGHSEDKLRDVMGKLIFQAGVDYE